MSKIDGTFFVVHDAKVGSIDPESQTVTLWDADSNRGLQAAVVHFGEPTSDDPVDFDLTQLPEVVSMGTTEFDADLLSVLTGPWGMAKLGKHWFWVLDKPDVDNGHVSMRVRLIDDPDEIRELEKQFQDRLK